MRNRLGLQLHLYGGTLVFFYLLMIGISAFHFNHPISFFKNKEKFNKEWQIPVKITDSTFTKEVLDKVTSETGIFGNVLWWTQRTDSIGTFHYDVNRPGKIYKIAIPKSKNILNIKEYNTGWGSIFISLHTLSTGQPESTISSVWKILSILLAFVSLVVVILSFYLWYKRAFKKKSQWLFIGIIGIISILYILYMWLVG